MALKDLLGDSFKDDMTIADIDKALEGRKLVDLSKGGYVDKEKFDRINDELKSSKTSLDEMSNKYKDYDSLVQFKTDIETKQAKENRIAKMKEAGVKDEYVEFVLYEIEKNGQIDDEKLVETAKTYVQDNKQYGVEVEPIQKQVNIKTLLPNGKGNDGQSDTPKILVKQPWMKNLY